GPRAYGTSFAGTRRASDGLRQFIFRGVTKVRDEWDLPCAALNLRRLRALGGRGLASTAAARGEPAGRNGAARGRGRRRSGYEAPNGLVAPGPVSSGAESKRRRCPRSRARQPRGTLLGEERRSVP